MVQKKYNNLTLYNSFITDREIKKIEEVLRKGVLTKGEYVEEFQERLREFTGRKYALLFNSGTSALLAAFHSLDVDNKKILVPDYTFPATATTALFMGGEILIGSVDIENYNLMPDVITGDVDIVVCVDQFGMPCNYDEIFHLKERYGFILVEDGACAMGSRYKGRMCGNFGEVSILSFHPRKVITTGEGGALLTDDFNIYKKASIFREHGIENGDILRPGLNLRMSDINAAMGIVQLENIEERLKKRRELFQLYKKEMGNLVKFQKNVEGAEPNHQAVVIRIERDRDTVIEELKKRGIDSVRGSYSLSSLTLFKGCEFYGDKNLSQYLDAHTIALPFYEGLEYEEIVYIKNELQEILTEVD